MRLEKFAEDASGIALRDIDIPEASGADALVRVHCAGLNPSDVRNAQGRMPQTQLPRTTGRDFCGEVQGLGLVFGSGDAGFTRDGTHAEYVLLPKAALVPKPERLSVEQAAACGVPYCTAYEALVLKCALHAGETVLVVGGGAVGQAAAQIAHWFGARVLLATRRDPSQVACGAFDEVLKLEAAKGVDVVLNTVGGATFLPSTQALGKGGRLASIAADAQRKEVSFDLFAFYRRELSFFGVDSLAHSPVEAASMLRRMLPGFASGALVPEVPDRMSLQEAPRAFADVLHGVSTKRVFTLF
ncbi:MAG TPA: zinc-binding alcohol dehydrogenase family protein [Myxococcales bacterium]